MRICKRSRFIAAFVFILTIIFSPAARSQEISVFAAPGSAINSWCNFHPVSNTGSLYVVYNGGLYDNGLYKSVRFSVSFPTAPGFFFTGANVLGLGTVPISTLQSGVTVQLGPCTSSAVTVAQINYFMTSQPSGLFPIKVIPDPSAPSGKIEFTRCDDVLVYVNEGFVGGNIGGGTGPFPHGPANPPTNPVPADGATGVVLDADVSALIHSPSIVIGCPELYGEGNRLYFGTNPNPPLISDVGYTSFPFDVGPLQPATTYYWRVVHVDTRGPDGVSPTWSFRTAEPVSTEAATWGRVKALYRN